MIDLRSDTVTHPTEAMRDAMAHAVVGDDVYGEDPTINALQEETAGLLGKQAGLFVASGTMGNLTAILAHAGRGDEAIVAADGHVMLWETGALSALGGVVPRTLDTDAKGRMDPARVEASVRGDDPHLPRSRLILLENTFGARNGAAIEPGYFATLREIADRHDLSMHLDGARLFNAVTALDVEPARLTEHVDSVTICLSKGLCAPVGSVLCGSHEFIDRARRARKQVGGGMRQAGVLAAAGRIAVGEMRLRLHEDHRRAAALREGLNAIEGVTAPPGDTNLVFFRLDESLGLDEETVSRRLREDHGVLIGADGPLTLRAVTHYWITDEDIDRALQALARTVRG